MTLVTRNPGPPIAMTPREIAQEAIKLIEQGWTDVEPSVDSKGRETACWSRAAVAWTLMGALCAVNCTDRSRLMVIGRLTAMAGNKPTMINTSKNDAIRWLSMVP